MKKHVLVSLADENYIDYVKQLFSSAYWKGGWNGDYMLLAYKVPEEKLKWFRDRGVIIKECEELPNNIHETSDFSEVVLNKFRIFSEEFKKWENVLFLDVDIIVRYDIKKLSKVRGFNVVSELFPLNPIKEPIKKELTDEDKRLFKEIEEKYGIDSVAKFNSGAMAFSTDIIKENTFSEIIDLSKKYHGALNFGEQPILSLYFRNNYKKLDRFYNYFVDENFVYYKIPYSEMNSVILHIFNKQKPWKKESYFYQEWKQNYGDADKIENFNEFNYGINKFGLINKIKFRLFYLYKDIYMYVDRKIGQLGIFLRKILRIKKNAK
jgi:lipopolysaccharide biosynthesis glycosyltransferase